jgi:uncharacterized membrane protein (Fun14 family)
VKKWSAQIATAKLERENGTIKGTSTTAKYAEPWFFSGAVDEEVVEMGDIFSPIIYMLIIGGIAGYFIAYLIKKILGLAVHIGVFAFLLMYFAYAKVINLNFGALGATLKGLADTLAPLGLIALISSAPFVGSFVVGLLIGFRRY